MFDTEVSSARHAWLCERALPWSIAIAERPKLTEVAALGCRRFTVGRPAHVAAIASLAPALGIFGSRSGEPTPSDPLRPAATLQEVSAGERFSARLPQIRPDTGFVPGGQGVAGSCKELRRLISAGFQGCMSIPGWSGRWRRLRF